VYVHSDRNGMALRDLGRTRYGGRIVAVGVEHAGAGDLILGDFFGLDAQAFVAPPEYGALSRGGGGDGIWPLVWAALSPLHVVEVHARPAQAFDLDLPAVIVTDGADVLGTQAEARAGHHGAGHLATGTEQFLLKRNLAGVGWKMRHDEQGIGGVQAHADDVEF